MKNARKYDRTCERCSTGFMAAKPQARFCSDNCRKRAGDDRNRAICEDCGGLLAAGTGNHYRRPYKLCGACYAAKAARNLQGIIDGYRAGLTVPEIADRLGIPPNTVKSRATQMRRQGIDLPYSPYAQARGWGVPA